MTFRDYLHTLSMAVVAVGLIAIMITGGYFIACSVGLGIIAVYGIFREDLSRILPVPTFIWNTIVIGLFLYLLYDSFYQSLDLVGNGVVFVILLQSIKLLAPKTPRDWMQIYALSFLHIIASTVLTSDISFSGPFLIYVLLITWTLCLFNIQQQAQKAFAGDQDKIWQLHNSRNIITRHFLLVTGTLSLLLIFVTLIIFFLFPRVSFKNFLRRPSHEQNIAGFSSEVELGTLGKIKSNERIALRIQFDPKTLGEFTFSDLYWRGTAADYFDGFRWIQAIRDTQHIQLDLNDPIYQSSEKAVLDGHPFEYAVLLESLRTPILFTLDRVRRIRWEKPIVEKYLRRYFSLTEKGAYGAIELQTGQKYISDLSYIGESLLYKPSAEVLRQASKGYPDFIKKHFLQLPSLHPDVEAFLQTIAPPPTNIYDQIAFLLFEFRKRFRYSLDIFDVGTDDPLRFFFIESRKGHCEYFSTAFIVALRYFGIPARQVMGFRGGEYNPYGDYLIVKQSDAHSWVEVYFPKHGWIRVDPTPPVTNPFSWPWLTSFHQLIDYFRLQWSRTIIDYDLTTQASIGEDLAQRWQQWWKKMKSSQPRTDNQPHSFWADRPKTVAGLFAALFFFTLAIGVYRFYRRRILSGAESQFSQIENVLSRHHLKRSPAQTPARFSKHAETVLGPLPALNKLTDMFYHMRYGQHTLDEPLWNSQLQQLKDEMEASTTVSKTGKDPDNVRGAGSTEA